MVAVLRVAMERLGTKRIQTCLRGILACDPIRMGVGRGRVIAPKRITQFGHSAQLDRMRCG